MRRGEERERGRGKGGERTVRREKGGPKSKVRRRGREGKRRKGVYHGGVCGQRRREEGARDKVNRLTSTPSLTKTTTSISSP